MTWQLEKAEAQFSELLDAAMTNGAQVVTRDGVLVSAEQWRRLQGAEATPKDQKASAAGNRPTLKDLLAAPDGLSKTWMIPERGRWKHREPIEF